MSGGGEEFVDLFKVGLLILCERIIEVENNEHDASCVRVGIEGVHLLPGLR